MWAKHPTFFLVKNCAAIYDTCFPQMYEEKDPSRRSSARSDVMSVCGARDARVNGCSVWSLPSRHVNT
jgi:hypothetical protein